MNLNLDLVYLGGVSGGHHMSPQCRTYILVHHILAALSSGDRQTIPQKANLKLTETNYKDEEYDEHDGDDDDDDRMRSSSSLFSILCP